MLASGGMVQFLKIEKIFEQIYQNYACGFKYVISPGNLVAHSAFQAIILTPSTHITTPGLRETIVDRLPYHGAYALSGIRTHDHQI